MKATIIAPQSGLMCEQCGEWPQRYSFEDVGLCWGCAFNDVTLRNQLPRSELNLIFEARSLLQDGAGLTYTRAISELVSRVLGMTEDDVDSVADWLSQPFQPAMGG